MPTSFMSGGSSAPMENSPPGIHTIPAGALPGAESEFGVVRVKFVVVDIGVEAVTIGLAFGKCVDDDFHTLKPPTRIRIVAAKPQGARFGGTTCGRLMTLCFLGILSST